MVSGLEQRKRLFDPEEGQQARSEPDKWGLLHEREHSRRALYMDVAEHECDVAEHAWPWQDLDRAELQRFVRKLLRARRARPDYATFEEIVRILWEHREQERAMANLEDAAEAGDKNAFLEILRRIEWQNRPPADFIRAVQLALEAGVHRAARRISAEGAKYYPQDSELQKY